MSGSASTYSRPSPSLSGRFSFRLTVIAAVSTTSHPSAATLSCIGSTCTQSPPAYRTGAPSTPSAQSTSKIASSSWSRGSCSSTASTSPSTADAHCSRHSRCDSSDTADTGSASSATPCAASAAASSRSSFATVARTLAVSAYTSAAVRPSALDRPAATAANLPCRPVSSWSLSELERPFTLSANSSLRAVWKSVVAVRAARTSARRSAGVSRSRPPAPLPRPPAAAAAASAAARACSRSHTSTTPAMASIRAASCASDPPATLARASGPAAPRTASRAAATLATACAPGAVSSGPSFTPNASRSVTSTSSSTLPPGRRCTVETASSVAITRAPRSPTDTKRAPAVPSAAVSPSITPPSAAVIAPCVAAKKTLGSPGTSAVSKAAFTAIDTVASDDAVRQNMTTVCCTLPAPAAPRSAASLRRAASRLARSGRGPVLCPPSVSITVTMCTSPPLVKADPVLPSPSRMADRMRFAAAAMPRCTPPRMSVIPCRGRSCSSASTSAAVSAA